MLNKDDLAEIKDDLLKREYELIDKLKRDKTRAREEEYSTELSDYDNHPGDSGTELFEREKDLALTSHEQTELTAIKGALDRIESNQYGQCSVCGETIETERLKAIPETIYCYQHADEQPEFDEEKESSMSGLENDDTNSWNTLEAYGTSASPSDFSSDHGDYNQLTENKDHDENEGDMDRYSNENKINE